MKDFFWKMTQAIRRHTPLWLHWKVGPTAAFVAYWLRMNVFGNKDAPHILSIHDTLDVVIKDNLSVIRFGDGEMSIMQGEGLGFQKPDPVLAERLKEIIQTHDQGLLICLPDLFGRLDNLAPFALRFALHHQLAYRQEWLRLLSPNRIYGNTFITRPYLAYTQRVREKSGEVFKKLFSLWSGKDVLLVEGDKSRVGVGNDMFKTVASLSRILGPAEHAYEKLEEIKREVFKVGTDRLVLLALGPAAKVLGYDLFRAGYRVIDIGHMDMEYEMFLRGQSAQTKVKYKYFNEIHERSPEDCTDPEYLAQIIAKVQ